MVINLVLVLAHGELQSCTLHHGLPKSVLLSRTSKQYLVKLFLEFLKILFFVLVTCLLWASCLHAAFLLLAEAHIVVSQVTACLFLLLCSSPAFIFHQLWQLLSPLLPAFLCSQLSLLHRCMVALCLEPRDPLSISGLKWHPKCCSVFFGRVGRGEKVGCCFLPREAEMGN